jgi:hypothetical protein
MSPPSKPSPVVPRLCAAMAVALEVVAEQRLAKARADVDAVLADASAREQTSRRRRRSKR